jgi:hypothetical protein
MVAVKRPVVTVESAPENWSTVFVEILLADYEIGLKLFAGVTKRDIIVLHYQIYCVATGITSKAMPYAYKSCFDSFRG